MFGPLARLAGEVFAVAFVGGFCGVVLGMIVALIAMPAVLGLFL